MNKIKLVDVTDANFDLIPRPANKKFNCHECFYWIGKKDGRLDQQSQKRKWFARKNEMYGSVGKLLYIQGEPNPIGFVQFGPIKEFETAKLCYVKDNNLLPKDGWCITCVIIDNKYRGQGLAGQMVKKVLSQLSKKGIACIDTYPATAVDNINDVSTATVLFWQKLGFKTIVEGSREIIMRKQLHGKTK